MVRGGRGDGARGRPGGAGKGGWGGPVPCPRRGGNGGGAAAAAASGMEGSRARPLGVAGRGAGAVRGLQGALPCPALPAAAIPWLCEEPRGGWSRLHQGLEFFGNAPLNPETTCLVLL